MKKIFIGGLVAVLGLASCTEVPIIVDSSVRGTDTTYMAGVETVQSKMFLVEEPSGVQCVQCPDGTRILKGLNSSGAYANKLVVVTLHAGKSFTTPINKDGKVSQYDFRTEVGDQILTTIFGGDVGKPCAGFDRLPIAVSSGFEGKILDYKNNWSNMLEKANEINGTPPVNVVVTPKVLDEANNQFEIEVKVSYTQAMTGKQAITVYILEDGINDYQDEQGKGIHMYEHNNVFRGVVSPFNGLEILPEMESKEAGRVVIQNFIMNVNADDAFQSTWNLNNVKIVAFVHEVGSSSQKVHQAAVSKLRK